MPKGQTTGKPTTRRYTPEEKAAAVRMVRTLCAELGADHGTVRRVTTQLGYGIESVRTWVKQCDLDDGCVAGLTGNQPEPTLRMPPRVVKAPGVYRRCARTLTAARTPPPPATT